MSRYAPQFANQFSADIAAAGSLSPVIDTAGYTHVSLYVAALSGTLTPGTLQFLASNDPAALYPLYDHSGARIGLPLTQTGGQAYARLDFVEPFRYIRVLSAGGAQGNGLRCTFSVKY